MQKLTTPNNTDEANGPSECPSKENKQMGMPDDRVGKPDTRVGKPDTRVGKPDTRAVIPDDDR